MKKQVIHATNIVGLDDLYNHRNNGNEYLCCSSLGCTSYLMRDVLVLVEGQVIAAHWGDIGSNGLDSNGLGPKNTAWNELHIENNYDVLGLYYHTDYSLDDYAAAYAYITYVLELPCQIYNASENVKAYIEDYADDMDDTMFADWLREWNIELEYI